MSGATAQFVAIILGSFFLIFALVMGLVLVSANKRDKNAVIALPSIKMKPSDEDQFGAPRVKEPIRTFSFEGSVIEPLPVTPPPSKGPFAGGGSPIPSRRSLREKGASTPAPARNSFFSDDDDDDIDFGSPSGRN